MGTVESGVAAYSESSDDSAWDALCSELEATASTVAARFAEIENAHLSFSEVHDLAQLVDLADEGLPLDASLVDFAMQCLMQVVDRAVRTRFRPNYFSEYRCLGSLWEVAVNRRRKPATTQLEGQREAQPAA
jgi:hypothetical protein